MSLTKMDPADLNSPCQEPSNGDFGIVVALTVCWQINFLTSQKGYDNSETTVGKLSARRIQIFFDYVCKNHF